MTEVDYVEDANLVYIIDDHRGLGFTNEKYYPVYEKNEQKYVIDDLGKENAGVFNCVKTKLYKCDSYADIHSELFVDNKDIYLLKEIERNSWATIGLCKELKYS